MQNKNTKHIPVLLNEVLEQLNIAEGETFVDGTLGQGGHSLEVAKLLGKNGLLIGIDKDEKNLDYAKKRLATPKVKTIFILNDFRNITSILQESEIKKVDKILLDLGWSLPQIKEGQRGFSFEGEERLLMTYKTNPNENDLTASEIVNEWAEESLADIFYGFGEEKFSRRIAKKIVEERAKKKIVSNKELVEIISQAVPIFYKHRRTHFATKVFQALRIATNDEIAGLKEFLNSIDTILNEQGRVSIISFHSIEDRIVKRFFRELEDSGKFRRLRKKPITASSEELLINKSARSAKLRTITKV